MLAKRREDGLRGGMEATAGFEPVMGVLQTPALTTWLRRLDKEGRLTAVPRTSWFGAEEGI